MLSFLKRFFGAKAAVSPCPEAPYKVEANQHFPFPKEEKPAKAKKSSTKKPVAKKPAKKTNKPA